MIYERIKSRLLPERSFLYFSYPQPGDRKDVGFYFPMFQNIAVNESQKSRVNQLDILGRSGNLFTFQGANSRQFRLQFTFNLDHIYHYVNEVGIPKIEFSNSKRKTRWIPTLEPSENAVDYKLDYYKQASIGLQSGRLETNKFTREFSRPLGDGEKIEKSLWDEFSNPSNVRDELSFLLDITGFLKTLGSSDNTKDDSVNLLLLLLNVVRTSTIGNSSNTSLGLPTIYLNHGTLYNNIPCICMDYAISFEETSTYEIFSMTPKTIKVSMNLYENRTGDFGKFEPFSHIKGENLAGWECVIDEGTMDPYLGRNYPDLFSGGGLA
jgi:hypothetical protein